jgi:hypothetical protein
LIYTQLSLRSVIQRSVTFTVPAGKAYVYRDQYKHTTAQERCHGIPNSLLHKHLDTIFFFAVKEIALLEQK